jgi:hypothetical protein
MVNWILANYTSGTPLNERYYPSEITARQSLMQLGEVFSRLYRPIPAFVDPFWHSALMEGFKNGDLENILLPQFSVDVYVPHDPDTDNIVVGFLIKGVPEAVFPFKQFCIYGMGVKHVDYGDSDTLPYTSVVYVEFDREKFHPKYLDDLVDQVCRIAGFSPEDFSVSFPNSTKTSPYSKKLIDAYFEDRTSRKNRTAQDKAVHDRTEQLQQELEHEIQHGSIGKRLGGATPEPKTVATAMKTLQKASGIGGGIHKMAKLKGPEITDATKNMIVNDAKRNLGQHTETWDQFDKRWSARLRVVPSRVSSIRKKVYDL